MSIGVLMPIGDKLKELRKAADLTQQALATAAGLSVSVVVQIESGRIPDPRVSTLKALAGAMGVTVDALLAEGPEPPAPEPPPTPLKGKPKKKPGGKKTGGKQE